MNDKKSLSAFWDSSALIPLCLNQPASKAAIQLFRKDTDLVIWWGTPVEGHSAFCRLHRSGVITSPELNAASLRLQQLRAQALEILPTARVREAACRLLRSHDLRAADSLQLAAALLWCEEKPHQRPFICFDQRLSAAAAQEGFLTYSSI